MEPAKPKRYVIQKHVMATSVKEALEKEAETPITGVFPDTFQPDDKPVVDRIGFKTIEATHLYEY